MSHKHRQREARSGLLLLPIGGGGSQSISSLSERACPELVEGEVERDFFQFLCGMIIEIQNRNYAQRNKGWKTHFNVSD
jgi:hypothetical protein